MSDETYGAGVYRKQGANELVVASGGTITIEEGGSLDASGLINGTPGAGFSGGTGTVIKSAVEKVGGIIRTSFLIDLTGLSSSTTDLDIIGTGANPAYFGRITAAKNGTILTGRVTCLEVPTGGVTDIDLYSATEATGVFDAGIGTLAETALLTQGGAWTLALTKAIGAVPAANEYLYLTGGAAGTAAAYTAGKFLIVFEGY
jgi:hypothetical protein